MDRSLPYFKSTPLLPNTPHEAMKDHHRLFLLNLLDQLDRSSTTPLDITHWTANNEKTVFHDSLPSGQWISKWSIVSPSFLHMKHQSITTTIQHLPKLSIVKILPKTAVQRKELTFCWHVLSKWWELEFSCFMRTKMLIVIVGNYVKYFCDIQLSFDKLLCTMCTSPETKIFYDKAKKING